MSKQNIYQLCSENGSKVDAARTALAPASPAELLGYLAAAADADNVLLCEHLVAGLGYRLEVDSLLRQGILEGLAEGKFLPALARPLMRSLVKLVKGRRAEERVVLGVMKDIACSPRQHPVIRASAARLAVRRMGSQASEIADVLSATNKAELVNCAANIASRAARHRVTVSASVALRVAAFATDNPDKAASSWDTLRLLADTRTPAAAAALARVAFVAKPKAAQVVISAAAHAIDPADLVHLVRKLPIGMLIPNLEQVTARLYAAGLHREYLAILGAQGMPMAAKAEPLTKLSTSRDVLVAAQARELKASKRAIKIDWSWLADLLKVPASRLNCGDGVGRKSRDASSSGLHLADAIYRDLDLRVVANHWHAGLFAGLSTDTIGNVHMEIIEVKNMFAPAVERWNLSRLMNDAKAELTDQIGQLRSDLLSAFQQGNPRLKVHGGRRLPNLREPQLSSIVAHANSLVGLSIGYTGTDMLDVPWSWKGVVSEIDDIRCDGLVEFAYERAGFQVCYGEDRRYWNVSANWRGADSHNDFHNHAYNSGELCPRIQAGDEPGATGATTLVRRDATEVPVIVEMKVMEPSAPGKPAVISWVLESPKYDTLFARLRVRKVGGSLKFIRSAIDPDGNGPLTAGDWLFRTVPANGQGACHWSGDVVGGVGFAGKRGCYEVLMTVVDKGGNVSETKTAKLTINW